MDLSVSSYIAIKPPLLIYKNLEKKKQFLKEKLREIGEKEEGKKGSEPVPYQQL